MQTGTALMQKGKTMNDLISRQDAIDAVSKYKKEHGYAYYDCACEIEKDIKQLPSAQAEIVRCKDCMHYGTYYRGNESKPVITHLCKWCLDRTVDRGVEASAGTV